MYLLMSFQALEKICRDGWDFGREILQSPVEA